MTCVSGLTFRLLELTAGVVEHAVITIYPVLDTVLDPAFDTIGGTPGNLDIRGIILQGLALPDFTYSRVSGPGSRVNGKGLGGYGRARSGYPQHGGPN